MNAIVYNLLETTGAATTVRPRSVTVRAKPIVTRATIASVQHFQPSGSTTRREASLLITVATLKQEVSALTRRLDTLESALHIVDDPEWDTAFALARSYFDAHKGADIYPDDLADALGMSVSLAIELCEALERDGKIRESLAQP